MWWEYTKGVLKSGLPGLCRLCIQMQEDVLRVNGTLSEDFVGKGLVATLSTVFSANIGCIRCASDV